MFGGLERAKMADSFVEVKREVVSRLVLELPLLEELFVGLRA